jgi:hypothetical protein
MIHLTFSVEDVSSVIKVYNQIEVQSSISETGPFTTVTGVGFPIWLSASKSKYERNDSGGKDTTWYQSRYGCSAVGGDSTCSTNGCAGKTSSWSDPVLGDTPEICYSPTYPVEVGYGTSEQLIIDRIRRLIGDPVGLKREYNECDNIHEGGKVYELETKGWPCSININGTTYNTTSNPAVNNYRYLQFSDDITTLSGVDLKVDIFYYTFRNSDREIMEAYDTCPPPQGLTTITANSESYMLQTAVELLTQELWEDATEDGAAVKDDMSTYNPEGGQKIRNDLIGRLQKRLDDLVKRLLLSGISGVLID